MILKTLDSASGRRQFLLNVLPAGTLLCLGGDHLLAITNGQDKPKPAEKKHKFLEDSGMSMQEVFEFAYKDYYIPLLRSLAPYFKNGDFIEILKRAADDQAAKSGPAEAKTLSKNDFATFKAMITKPPEGFEKQVLTVSTVEVTDRAIESKVTECLWAKTFRKANASDIGYARICYPDFASARAYSPKLKLIRTKTLMQGDDCCNHRWVWEG
jgi:hypothetical protein